MQKSATLPHALGDLLHGIDDLLTLRTLEPFVEKLEGEEKSSYNAG